MSNTVAYENPVTGATPPTAAVMQQHQSLSALVTGDGAATSFTITHNWGLTTAQQNAPNPWVAYEAALAAFYTANPVITGRTANTVTFSCTAYSGAAVRVRLQRPFKTLT